MTCVFTKSYRYVSKLRHCYHCFGYKNFEHVHVRVRACFLAMNNPRTRCKLWATGVETWRWEWSPEAQMMLGRLALWRGIRLISRTHARISGESPIRVYPCAILEWDRGLQHAAITAGETVVLNVYHNTIISGWEPLPVYCLTSSMPSFGLRAPHNSEHCCNVLNHTFSANLKLGVLHLGSFCGCSLSLRYGAEYLYPLLDIYEAI